MEINTIIKKGNTEFVDDFSKEVYEQTYKFGEVDKDINDTHYRVAKDLASVENDVEYWTEQFVKLLEDFKFVPGGRITSNAGTSLKGTTYINCFVDGFDGEDQDSMEGILSTLRRQALILKSEGGYGFCADVMRPRGGFIGGIGNESPGSVRMLDMWDTQSGVITEGSGRKTQNKKGKQKIRKGAQMVTMSCWHPDIEEYITAKLTPGRLTKFNMSVLITDELMNAVKNNSEWQLIFPDYDVNDETKELYKKEWNGNIKEWIAKGYPTKVYKTFNNANELWDLIMSSTYNRNEPGVLFVDTMNKMNNLYYCEHITATNPCGEQVLPIGGVCLLGSLNLTQFIDFEKKDWNYEKLGEMIPVAVRFMDNVNDKTYVPLPSQTDNLKNKRRIGLGIMGYGSALMMMKVRYGSDKAIELTEKLMSFIANNAYQSSALIAKDKGTFTLYDESKYLSGNFVKALSKETIDLIKKYGLRNSHLLSIQPTGNSSVFANNVSGGLEPLFLPEYVRTAIMPYAPEGLFKPKNINWDDKSYDCDGNTEWRWKKEGDENVLWSEFNGYIWKFDKSRGLLRETVVRDYAVRFLDSKGEWDAKADWSATTNELNINDHISTMGVMAKYIDSAMSKTINLPNEYPYEDFKKLYMGLYDTGTVKGGTTYRAGTMTTVLSEKKSEENESVGIKKTNAPKRPKTLECDIHNIVAEGNAWIVLIGLLGKDPYEVFAFKKKNIQISSKFKTGKLTKVKSGRYDLELDGFTLEDIKTHFETNEEQALTRAISFGLRHGGDIQYLYDQLLKAEGNIISFSKAVARTLKKYISDDAEVKDECINPNCPNDGKNCKIVREEGCKKCLTCGYSACQ